MLVKWVRKNLNTFSLGRWRKRGEHTAKASDAKSDVLYARTDWAPSQLSSSECQHSFVTERTSEAFCHFMRFQVLSRRTWNARTDFRGITLFCDCVVQVLHRGVTCADIFRSHTRSGTACRQICTTGQKHYCMYLVHRLDAWFGLLQTVAIGGKGWAVMSFNGIGRHETAQPSWLSTSLKDMKRLSIHVFECLDGLS